MSSQKKFLFILLAATSVIYLLAWHLALTRGLTCTLEGETALTAREFLKYGDWAVNHMNGQPDFDKPSLFYWLVALASLATGGIKELTVRIPSLLSGAGIMAMFLLYRQKDSHFDPRTLPALSAFVFISSNKVMWMSQVGRIDMTLCLVCFAAITIAWRHHRNLGQGKSCLRLQMLFHGASGIAVLLKGPVGVLATWPAVSIFLIFKRRWRELAELFLNPGMILFLVMTIPWYLYACISTDWEFFRHFFLAENISRFGNLWSGMEFKQFNHSSPWLYLAYLFSGFFPWSIILPLACFCLLRQQHTKPGAQGDDWQQFLLIYAGWVLLFFTLCGVKRSDYILPLYPAAALLTGDFMLASCSGLRENCARIRKILPDLYTAAAWFLLAVTAVAALAAILLGIDVTAHTVSALLPEKISTAIKWLGDNYRTSLAGAALACFAGALVAYASRGQIACRETAFLAGAACCAWIMAGLVVLPFIEHCKDMKNFCTEAASITGGKPLYAFVYWDEECAFYLGRESIPKIKKDKLLELLRQKNSQVFILAREKEMERLKKNGIEIPGKEIEWIMQTPPYKWRKLFLFSNIKPDNAPPTELWTVRKAATIDAVVVKKQK